MCECVSRGLGLSCVRGKSAGIGGERASTGYRGLDGRAIGSC